ncbi:hypothetical protein [Streptomyces sp. NPDC094472]|uniref:hypothetical protein n=1 Tax=unclassified Streptomyces TaxID=2593676 RepID=UPI00332D0945
MPALPDATGFPETAARLVEIIRNLAERIAEARTNGWLGEVQGFHVSLAKAKEKLVALERSRSTGQGGPTDLGMPSTTKLRSGAR